ncbi:MAG: hypothetical protein H0W12_10600 [Chitinophagaceae bacterium]|nr:hypothetical protein [Chitinophagaceae bacterium]
MEIIVLADEEQQQEFLSKKINPEVKIIFTGKTFQAQTANADAIFILLQEIPDDLRAINKTPVFINAVSKTLNHFPIDNVHRFNGWNGFINRPVWEIASNHENIVTQVFKMLQWQYTLVKDEPGMVTARILSMIINEAYYAFGEGVSTKKEIDLAMKLGTNYPYGPFEWANKIGLNNIYGLLKILEKNNERYTVAEAMQNEMENKKY